jgi:hypothetical protein
MIISKLSGGLGNQLFQYAIGKSLAQKHNTILKLDISEFSNDFRRRFSLDNWLTSFQVATASDIHLVAGWGDNKHKYIRPLNRFLGKHIYYENQFMFIPEFQFFKNNSLLIGCWQSFWYFANIENELKTELQLTVPLSLIYQDFLREINTETSVSIHIRRGDYVNNSYYARIDMNYYLSAIQFIINRIGDITVFVFSDDIPWCRENINTSCTVVFVDTNLETNPNFDLWLMSRCKHNVIANSSFSWWAAWLNPNPDKMVIAPKNWFSDPKILTRDLFLANWDIL